MEEQQSEQNTLAQNQSSNELHHKVHKLSRIFVILSAVIGIATSIFFFYFYFIYQPPESPLSDTKPQTAISPAASDVDMANWKTYTNTTYSIKYPQSSDITDENGIVYIHLNQAEYTKDVNSGKISSYIQPQIIIYKSDIDSFKKIVTDLPAKNKTVGLLIGTEYTQDTMTKPFPGGGDNSPYTSSKVYFFSNNGLLFRLSTVPEYLQTDMVLFDQILSTFKFLDTQNNNTTYSTTNIEKICTGLLASLEKTNEKVQFEDLYCTGELCLQTLDDTECNAKDIIRINNGKIVSGQDGIVDCKWVKGDDYGACVEIFSRMW